MQRQFWWLQIIGWLTYTLVVYITVVSPSLVEGQVAAQVLHLIIEIMMGFLSSLLLWTIVIQLNTAKTPLLILTCVGLAALFAFGFNLAKLVSFQTIVNHSLWNSWSWQEFGRWYLFSFATILVWATFFIVILYNDKLQKEQTKTLQAQSLAKESQLRMLRYQLNPHFMFNSMNSISTLILQHETEKANDMLELLCDFLRYSLEADTELKTTLREELKSVELYLQIEKVRFGGRLQYQQQAERILMPALVPSFFLQPIIENSVKYAIVNNKHGGSITIEVTVAQGNLCIEVADRCNSKESSTKISQPSLGIGLKNIDERLQAIYGSKYSIAMNQNEHLGMTVRIIIPLEVSEPYDN